MSQGRRASGPDHSISEAQQGRAVLTLAQQVSAKRKAAGLSQHQLAKYAGLGTNGVNRLEKAAVDPKLSSIERVAIVLGSTPSDLLKETDSNLSRLESIPTIGGEKS
ncbi:MAG: helix-turn-helix transcriptional regulator [Patescibacteria group bacterium]|nr:helix-turn-helix transcriptional regulator [Patescibacteria group bacterium]